MAQIHIDIVSDSSNAIAQVQAVTQQIRELSSNISALDEKTRKMWDSPEKYMRQLEKTYTEAQETIEKTGKEIDKLAQKSFKAATKGDEAEVQRLTAQMDALAQKMQEASGKAEGARKEMLFLGKTEGEIEKLTVKGKALKTIFGGITAVVGAAAAAVGLWLKKTASGQAVMIRLRDTIDEWAVKIFGVSKRTKEFDTEVRRSVTGEITLYRKLQKEWEKANGSMEKKRRIVASDDWQKLGLSVNSVSQAEKILVDNTNSVVTALTARAKAAALIKRAEQEAAQAMMLTDAQAVSNTLIGKLKTLVEEGLSDTGNPILDKIGKTLLDGINKIQGWSNNVIDDVIAKKNERMNNALMNSIDYDEEARKILSDYGAYNNKNYNQRIKAWNEFVNLKKQLSREAERRVQDNAFVQRQAEIDALDEGSKKVREQMRLNYEQEKAEIDRWYDGLRDEKIARAKEEFEKNPENKDAVFTYNRSDAKWNATKEETDLYNAKTNANDKKYLRERKQLYEQEVEEYGSYQEKRALITEKWAKKIANLQNPQHMANAKRERDAELAELETKYSGVYARIYADIDGFSQQAIQATIRLAEQELARLALAGQATSEVYKNLRERIEQLKEAGYNSAHKSYGTSFNAIGDALFRRNLARTRREDAESALASGRRKLLEPEQIQKLANALQQAKQQEEGLNDELEKTIILTGMQGLGGAFEEVGSILTKLGREEGAVISQIGSAITGVISQLASGNVPAAIAAGAVAAVDLITDIIKTEEETAKKAARRNYEYARSLQAIADERKQAAFDTILGKDEYGSIVAFNEQAKDAASNIETIQGEAQKSEVTIRNWLAMLATFYGPFGTIKGLLSLKDFANGEKMQGELIADSRNWWQKFTGQKEGIDVKQLSDFYDEQGRLKGDELRAWADANSEYLTDETKLLIDKLLGEWARYEEGTEAVFNGIKDLIGDSIDSAADEMIDNYLKTGSAIADMSDNMQEFAQAQAKAMLKSALFKKFFDDFDQQGFIDKITSDNEDLVAEAVADYKRRMEALSSYDATGLLEKFGLSLASEAQKVTGGAFQTMSETTGTELNGRFTALQISGDRILEEAVRGTELLASGNVVLVGIRDLQYEANQHLGDIVKYTKNIYEEWAGKLDAIQQNTSRL